MCSPQMANWYNFMSEAATASHGLLDIDILQQPDYRSFPSGLHFCLQGKQTDPTAQPKVKNDLYDHCQ